MSIIIILILQVVALRHRKVNFPIYASNKRGIWGLNPSHLTLEPTTPLTDPYMNSTLHQPGFSLFLNHGTHFLMWLSNFPSRDTLPPCSLPIQLVDLIQVLPSPNNIHPLLSATCIWLFSQCLLNGSMWKPPFSI